jgi:3',5'-cyclic AMP phosphodiesterase CpdA
MPRILHLTDTHLVVPRDRVSGVLDTAALLQRAVAAIAGALPRIGPVDALLVTGDLSDDGSVESYELFRRLVAPLDLPLLAIPGNHDRREAMRAAFRDLDLFADAGRLNWVRDVDGMRLIGLDTLVEGSGGGVVDEATLAFLDESLATPGPVLLAMHHPPFACGIRFMDGIGLAGIEALRAVLERSPADIRILCGHLHLVATGSVGRIPAIVGPSPCSTFRVDFRPEAPVGFFTGSGGFMVHDWSGGFRSMHVPPGMGEGPFAF